MILRGSGASTAALARLAADNGVRTLAHAEGGGVLYVHGSAQAERVTAIVDSSLDRLGVCNRLNLALVDREAAGLRGRARRRVRAARREVVGTARAAAVVPVGQLDEPIGYEWASDPARVATVTLDLVDDLAEAAQIANTETSALAAGIVAEDADAVERFFALYRGTSAFWHASTRFADGFELTGTPETGINVEWAPGPAGAGHLPRPVAAPVPRRRRRHPEPMTSGPMTRPDKRSMRIVVKLGSSLVATPAGAVRRTLLAARAKEVAELVAGGHSVCIVSSGAIALGAPRLGFARRPSTMRQLQAASAVGQAQLHQAWERALRRVGLQAAQLLLSPADMADRQTYVNVCNTFDALFRLGSVPVVNENDATATDEITFGDNDSLAAQVAVLTRARLLVLLTEVDGVYSRAPGTPGAELLDDGSLSSAVGLGRVTGLGRGGMGSKIAAAQLAAGAGIPTVIASGQAGDGARPDRGGGAQRHAFRG